jgi:hypothetical protein
MLFRCGKKRHTASFYLWFPRFSTGAHNYQDSTTKGISTLYVDGQKIGNYTFTQTTLPVDQGIDFDGSVTEFGR